MHLAYRHVPSNLAGATVTTCKISHCSVLAAPILAAQQVETYELTEENVEKVLDEVG